MILSDLDGRRMIIALVAAVVASGAVTAAEPPRVRGSSTAAAGSSAGADDERTKSSVIDWFLALERATAGRMHLSSDGRRLALAVRPMSAGLPAVRAQWLNEEVRPSRVVIVDTASGERSEPFPAGSTSWGGRWSPDGSLLAAWVCHDGPPCLGIWEAETSRVRYCRAAPVRPCYADEGPEWTPDGRSVVVKLVPEGGLVEGDAAPPALRGAGAMVAVFSFDPAAPAEEKTATTEPTEELLCDLGCVDAANGAVRRLARGWAVASWSVAPDGQAVAVRRRAVRRPGWAEDSYDLMVVPLDGSPARRVAAGSSREFGLAFNWSPDGRRLAYSTYDGRRLGRVYVVPADGSSGPIDLTGEERINLRYSTKLPPAWSDDGRTVYVLARASRDVWVLPTAGGTRRRLPIGPGLGIRGWVQGPLRPTLPTPGHVVQIVFRDHVTKDEGILRLDLASGVVERSTTLARTFVREDGLMIEAAPDGSTCYLVAEDAGCPPEVWRIGDEGRRPERVCRLNPPLDAGRAVTSRLVEWAGPDGRRLRGALMLPPGYREGRRVPVVFQVYEGPGSDWLHLFSMFDPLNYLLAIRGYAVILPDLPRGDRDSMQRWTGLVLPAVDRLVELGIADSDRVGLMGESYGGYMVLALLTQTTRFRAALAVSADVNLTSAYGALTDDGDSFAMPLFERPDGQNRRGGTLWERRDDYIENSPLFFLDRVRTPVLLVAGAANCSDPFEARQAFSALRRLRQKVELRLYGGEGHGPMFWSKVNRKDFYERALTWFDLHLASAPGSPPRTGK